MPDVRVREATTADVAALAEVQVQTWRAAYADVLPPSALAAVETSRIEAGWRAALDHATAPARVLVAIADGRVVGLTAIAPATDDDLDADTAGEMGPLLVLPDARRQGHGSRLLAAATDLLRESGRAHVVLWCPAADALLRQFLERAGWALDGARRTLDADGAGVDEVRLHTELLALFSPD